jgi:hypothetical protein
MSTGEFVARQKAGIHREVEMVFQLGGRTYGDLDEFREVSVGSTAATFSDVPACAFRQTESCR